MSTHIKYYVHGTTKDNENHISTGWNKTELSDLGIKQTWGASKTTKKLRFNAIFCSDLHRTKQSAQILFDRNANLIKYDSRLRECDYGVVNGKSNKEVIYINHIDVPFEKGESMMDVEKRMRDLLKYISRNYANKSIALISHRAPQLALEVILNNKSWEQAISDDWRTVGVWQLGWNYIVGK